MKTTLPKEFICSVFKMWPWPHCFVKIFIHINGGPINVNHVPSLLLSHLFGSGGFFAPPYRTVDITNARWSTSQMHAFVRLTSEVDWGVSTQTESPLLRDLVNDTNAFGRGYFTLSMGHLPIRFCFICPSFCFISPSNLLHFPNKLLHLPNKLLHFPNRLLHFPNKILTSPSLFCFTLPKTRTQFFDIFPFFSSSELNFE